VSFKPGLNVLLGENNIGKTNLLDAMRWALGVQSVGRDAAVLLDREDRRRKPDGTFVDEPIHVTLQFERLSFDERAEFLDILNYNETAPEQSTATTHCEWSYSETRDKWTFRRWGGDRKNAEGAVSDELLQALPLIFLEALRDAERELAPGKRSRLARYLQAAANDTDREDIVKIGTDTNKALKGVGLVKRAEDAVAAVLKLASGTDLMREAAIRPAPTDFDRIIQTLRVLLKPLSGEDDDDLLEGLDSNGLGYNNLIYIATVLAELQARKDSPVRMLVVEEPEAQLVPQLLTILGVHL
jgi:putative ATP-dependent endonuclease of OLD family